MENTQNEDEGDQVGRYGRVVGLQCGMYMISHYHRATSACLTGLTLTTSVPATTSLCNPYSLNTTWATLSHSVVSILRLSVCQHFSFGAIPSQNHEKLLYYDGTWKQVRNEVFR